MGMKLAGIKVGQKVMITNQQAAANLSDTGRAQWRAGKEWPAKSDSNVRIGKAGYLSYAKRIA